MHSRTLRRIGHADAGSGPVQVASDGGDYLYVTDAIGGSVLVFHSVPELTLVRRYGMAGNPWAIVHDTERRRNSAKHDDSEHGRRNPAKHDDSKQRRHATHDGWRHGRR